MPAFGKLGLVPEVGTSWLLTRRLGYHGAIAYCLGGRHISAEEALELGLVQDVVPHDQLMASAATWCERAEQMPDHALEMTKTLLRGAADALGAVIEAEGVRRGQQLLDRGPGPGGRAPAGDI